MKNPIDEHFKQGLESLEVKPRADLWQQKIAPHVQPKQKKAVIWYRAAAVIVLLLSGWYTVNNVSEFKETEIFYPEFSVAEEAVKPKGDAQILPTKQQVSPKAEMAIVAIKRGAAQTKKTTKSPIENQVAAIHSPTEILVLDKTVVAAYEKPKVKVSLRLNPANYFEKVAPVELAVAESGVKAYAKNQWNNFKNGDKLDAPTLEMLDLPKVAVRFEGNPLRRILPGGQPQ